MTIESHQLKTEWRLVVCFDMCSSSVIVDDLKSTDNLGALRDLLIRVKEFLVKESQSADFEVYKFTGDGWILLFPDTVEGESLLHFLEKLSAFFRANFEKLIASQLQLTPSVTGLRFGIDGGVLIRMVMMQNTEYIGRPLNVASRLQGAIGDRDKNPAYKCLLSRHAFLKLKIPKHEYEIVEVWRNLKNIQGGQRYECIKLTLK